MNKYSKAYTKALEKKRSASWFDTAVLLLANDLADATGMDYNLSGPYGLRAEVYIVLSGNDKESQCLVVTPEFEDGELILYYDTGKTENRFASGTIGAIHGFNNIIKPVPDTVKEIVKLLRPYK